MASKRRLGRPTDQRMLMLRNLVTSLLDKGRIVTTVTRAKEARSLAEEMITLAKKGDLHSRRRALAFVTDETVVKNLFDKIGPKYADREGGYTRIVKIGPRRGDAAEMVILELV
ncbi:MAG: 50S ribosomal protein L17 [Clostridiales bacterium]|jgi:large subunit ribosomal protein L17|nr:50S ribosomal protein L17 [Clostridiales bacterium]NLZ90755.1 50S ribosomal protein L17 [Clostridiales bacterium]HOC08634.1 50S ribosomal protein L17 [Bacillota bacterium]HQD41109.1 50S ribosomal protein L17 [Bacillota bacterium]